jgi:hypothetical protein
MGAPVRTCTCCRSRVHISLIKDVRVQRPVCLDCYAKRLTELRTYPTHFSRALPPSHWRLVRL